VKSEWASGKKDRKGKRQHLSDAKTREMLKKLNRCFEYMIESPIRIGNRQTIAALVDEETLLLAKFPRDERQSRLPRMAIDPLMDRREKLFLAYSLLPLSDSR